MKTSKDYSWHKGWWIKHYLMPDTYTGVYWSCSVCGFKCTKRLSPCPYCKARMSEGEEDGN